MNAKAIVEVGEVKIPGRETQKNSSGRVGRTVAFVSALLGAAGQSCDTSKREDTPQAPSIGQTAKPLTINDLNPARAPLVLPLSNGQTARVTQRAGGAFSHDDIWTAHAVDLRDESFDDFNQLALTPVTGTVTRNAGNCQGNPDRTDNRCNDGWGNTVELEDRGGGLFIFGHCDSYAPEAPDGAFVLKGTPVCRIGSTGHSTAAHVHFDKVERAAQGRYTSLGVTNYITMRRGDAEPSLFYPDDETPNVFETCCGGGCDQESNNVACDRHISFNRPLTLTLRTFAEEVQNADQRIVRLTGDIVPDENFSRQLSPWVVAYQRATLQINGREVETFIYFVAGSPSGAGQRNPFIDFAWSFVWDPDAGNWMQERAHTQVHTPRFVNFDLWDLAKTVTQEDTQFTTQVSEIPNWNEDWELWTSQFPSRGGPLDVYLAVWKQDKGRRFGTFPTIEGWAQWHEM